MKNLELLEKYLNEELTAQEQQAFEQLQNTDADFAEEVQMAVAINADFNIQQKKRWQALLSEQATETPIRQLDTRKKMVPNRTLSIGWIRSIAAVFVLGLGLSLAWMLFASPDLETIANDHLVNIYNSPTVTMSSGDLDANWKTAINAYQEGDFSTAVAAIKGSMETEDKRLDEKHFYLGLSYLYQEVPNLDKAIENLEKGKSLNSVLYAPQANWFMSLAHLKKGNKEEAEVLLQQIVDHNGWKKTEAAALLNQL